MDKAEIQRRILNIFRICFAVFLTVLMGIYVYHEVSAQIKEVQAQNQDKAMFEGKGTMEEPYQIRTAEDLASLAMTVNEGNVYDGDYFVQTADLDMAQYSNWISIGTYNSGFAFAGIYDGDGHKLFNITIAGDQASGEGNVGLLGRLGGIVCNLGIESGTISSACVGSIASHSASDKAIIANCYNKAALSGTRCGGIADNFGNARIICCANSGQLTGGTVGNIVSYSAGEIYGCHGTGELISNSFRGLLKKQYVEEVIDFSELNSDLSEAKDLYDLQNIELKEW